MTINIRSEQTLTFLEETLLAAAKKIKVGFIKLENGSSDKQSLAAIFIEEYSICHELISQLNPSLSSHINFSELDRISELNQKFLLSL